MGEGSLHEAVKNWYATTGDHLEKEVDGYLVDIVRGGLLIEIQTGNFSALKSKLSDLIQRHPLRLVYPIAQKKWIVRIDTDGETKLSRRRSPRRGRVEDLFYELVYIHEVAKNPNFSLEVLLVHSEEVLINDGRGSWRRRRWSVHDRRLLEVVDRATFSAPSDFLKLLPASLPERFTTRDLAGALKLRPTLSQKMVYCLRHVGVVEAVGKRGRAVLYAIPA